MMWQGSARDLNVVPAYFGGDVAEKVITENRERFAEHHNKRFEVWDLTKCPVPQFRMKDAGELQSFQMVLTRDVIMHLRYDCLLLSILKLIGELTLFLVISFKLRERSQIHQERGVIAWYRVLGSVLLWPREREQGNPKRSMVEVQCGSSPLQFAERECHIL